MNCPHCGVKLDSDARFCSDCGRPVAPANPAKPPVLPTQPFSPTNPAPPAWSPPPANPASPTQPFPPIPPVRPTPTPNAQAGRCIFCGAEMRPNTTLCHQCWKEQNVEIEPLRCEKCGKPIPQGMTACPHCTGKSKLPMLIAAVAAVVLLAAGIGIWFFFSRSAKANDIDLLDYFYPNWGDGSSLESMAINVDAQRFEKDWNDRLLKGGTISPEECEHPEMLDMDFQSFINYSGMTLKWEVKSQFGSEYVEVTISGDFDKVEKEAGISIYGGTAKWSPTDKKKDSATKSTQSSADAEKSAEDLQRVFPDSSSTELRPEDIQRLDDVSLQHAACEILAAKGYTFVHPELQSYYEQFDWYAPSIAAEEFNMDLLNTYEKQNLLLIQKEMAARQK